MPDSLLRVLACGSVDDGKSTLIGRLLFDCGAIPDDVMTELERDSLRLGAADGGIDYALLVDGLEAEREQGVTIDVAYRFFETPKRRIILADSPGHQQYTRNMASGASKADLAILLIDAQKGILDQTRRHAAIVSLMGVRNLVLAVNKMDLVGFDQAVFGGIVSAFGAVRDQLPPMAVTAIPICARDGDNITFSSQRTAWYDGGTLLRALEDAHPSRDRAAQGARMPVQYVNRPDPTFRGYCGTISGGALCVGDTVINAYSRIEAKIQRIVTMGGDLRHAPSGSPVTLVLDREIDVSRGDVLARDPVPMVVDQVDAWIVWMDETPLFRGRAYQFMLGTKTAIGTVTEISTQLNIETLQETSTRELGLNEIGRVTISISPSVVAEPYTKDYELGGFILVDRVTRTTAGAGMIIEVRSPRSNLHWHQLDVDKATRAALKGQQPAILWFTGLSGAGKSTIANLVEKGLVATNHHTILLDGDNVRHGLNRDLGFSEADRVENIRRIAEVSKIFVEAGLIVLVSFISPYRNERSLARACVEDGEFFEIYVDTPVEECSRRDPKGLYQKAYAGQIRNFTGVDAPYEPPLSPEIHLRTMESSPEHLAHIVLEELRMRGITP